MPPDLVKIADMVHLIKWKYMDSNNHIVQADGDGGDSLNRLGCADACLYFLKNCPKPFLALALPSNQPSPGRFCRNPDPRKWYSNPNNVTRDQMIPVEAAFAIGKSTELARIHIRLRAKRFFFHFSTENDGKDAGPLVHKFPDPPTPSELGLLIRAWNSILLYPLLYFFDLFLLLDVLVTRRISDRNRYDYDNQLLPMVLASVSVMPTFFSRISAWFYSKTDAGDRLASYYAEGLGKNGIEPLGIIMNEAFRTL